MNTITITGKLGKDPEQRFTPAGVPIAKFSVATNRPTKERETDWFECEVWRQGAEYVSKYAKKGSTVAVNGRMENDKWEDRDGNKRDGWRLKAERVEVLEGRSTQADSDVEETVEIPF